MGSAVVGVLSPSHPTIAYVPVGIDGGRNKGSSKNYCILDLSE
jgi:hypothetical protein